MRTDRISKGVILRELDEARRTAATTREALEILGGDFVKMRAQRDVMRKFADTVDHVVGVGRLMLEAGMPVRGDFVLHVLDDALDDVCKATGGVRTPMRQGMTAEELQAASMAFLGAMVAGSRDGEEAVVEGVEAREASLMELGADLDAIAEEKATSSSSEENKGDEDASSVSD